MGQRRFGSDAASHRNRAARSGARASAWLGVVLLGMLLLAGCGTTTGWQGLIGNSNESFLSLVVDPLNTSIFFAGTSNGTFYRGNGGSAGPPTRDGTGLPSGEPINAILPDPSSQTRIFLATNRGLYVSNNLGDTWGAYGTGFPTSDAMETLTFGASPSTLFAGSDQHGVFASFDGGKTWHAASAGLPAAQVYTLSYDDSTHTLYAGLVGHGIATSTDRGATWTTNANGLPSGDDVFMFLRLADHGLVGNGPTIYAATAKGLYATTNGGQQWNAVGGLPSGRVLSLAADSAHPGTLYAGTDTDVDISQDGGQHWSTVATGLHAQVAALAVTSGSNQSQELFAAAGALYRYPPKSGGALSVVTVILIIAAVIVFGFILFRQRRTRQDFVRHAGEEHIQGPQRQPPGERFRDQPPPRTSASDHNGHRQRE